MIIPDVDQPGEKGFSGLIVFFLSFSFLSVFSVSPSVYPGDSGIFTAASFYLGSAHPPAYPLYMLFGKLTTFIPFGNIALKVNLMSALFGALCIAVAYQTTFYLTKNTIVSIVTPLIILASPNFILESSKAEVYSLNAFLIMLIFYFCLRALKEDAFFKYILAASFILGLGMANHHTIGFMLIVILYVAIVRRNKMFFRVMVFSAALFLLGLSVYFYLYCRTIVESFMNYTKVYSVVDMFSVFFRTAYSTGTLDAIKAVSVEDSGWFYSLRNVWRICADELHPIVWVLVLTGAVSMIRDKRKFGFLLVSLFSWVLLAKMTISSKEPSSGAFSTVSPYYLQLIPLFGVIAATGLHAFFEQVRPRSSLVAKAGIAGIILFQFSYVPAALQRSSLSDYILAYNYIHDISKILKPKSFFLAFGDNPDFLSFYGFGVERLRDDVVCLDGLPNYNYFHLNIAPQWKFGKWYPEFYKSKDTSIKYFYPIAKEGRLYASNFNVIPEWMKKKVDPELYVLVTVLKPKGYDFPLPARFKEDFQKIDYLPILYSYKPDPMANEIITHYVYSIWMYADLLAEENSKDTDYFYKLAFAAGTKSQRDRIIKDYMYFLEEKRGPGAVKEVMDEFKIELPAREKNSTQNRVSAVQ